MTTTAPPPEEGSTAPGHEGELPLSPKVVGLWRLGHALGWSVVVFFVAIVFLLASDLPAGVRYAIPVAVAAVGLGLTVWLPAAQYERWRYQVTSDGIELRHGLLVRNRSSIPHFRVQHVDLRQGILQRWRGVVSLSISTASPATDASLPGLEPHRAEHIRRQVIERAEADDGV